MEPQPQTDDDTFRKNSWEGLRYDKINLCHKCAIDSWSLIAGYILLMC